MTACHVVLAVCGVLYLACIPPALAYLGHAVRWERGQGHPFTGRMLVTATAWAVLLAPVFLLYVRAERAEL